MLRKDYDSKDSAEKKSQDVSLKRLGAKTNWSEVNRQSQRNSDSDERIVMEIY
jgi:hypothetical protein